jgi:hypothetical protein
MTCVQLTRDADGRASTTIGFEMASLISVSDEGPPVGFL